MSHDALYQQLLSRARALVASHPRGPNMNRWSLSEEQAYGATLGRELYVLCPSVTQAQAQELLQKACEQVSLESELLSPLVPSPAELERFYQEFLCRGRAAKNTHPKGRDPKAWTPEEQWDFGYQLGAAFEKDHPGYGPEVIASLMNRMSFELCLEDCRDPLEAARLRAAMAALYSERDASFASN